MRTGKEYIENGGTEVFSRGGWGLGDVLAIGAGLELGRTPWQIAQTLPTEEERKQGIIAII